MPVDKSMAPEPGYKKAGALGKDMKPGKRTKKSRPVMGGNFSMTDRDMSPIKYSPAPSGMKKNKNYTSDEDMGLIKHSPASKY